MLTISSLLLVLPLLETTYSFSPSITSATNRSNNKYNYNTKIYKNYHSRTSIPPPPYSSSHSSSYSSIIKSKCSHSSSLLYTTIQPPNNEHDTLTTTPPPSPYSNQPYPNAIPSPTTLSTLSKTEQEFYSMMTQFTLYTPYDISTITNPSYKILFEGVTAGYNNPIVMNSFAIIYNDLYPIRIAGRMIYNHLKGVMEDNIEKRKKEEERIGVETGLSIDAIYDGRKAFMAALNSGNSGDGSSDDGYLTMTELIESGIVEMVIELMEYQSFEDFFQHLEQDENEKINFERFMIGLQKCALMKNSKVDDDGNVFCDVSCDLEEVLSVTAQRMAPIDAKKNQMTVSERKKKYSDRYDEMVKSFEEWEALVPSGDGRMIQVLNGCFAGAKSEKIVQALKIVYLDYSALRVGGDLVFKLMGKLVNRRMIKN